MAKSKPSLYFVSILLFLLVLPVSSIWYGYSVKHIPFGWILIGKWFVFWSVGIRLFIAGMSQVTRPEFTANKIFNIRNADSHAIIKELGFANLSIGLIGILSLFKSGWCAPAAIAGGLFYGMAGILHIMKKPDSRNELVAMISDIFIAIVMLLYVLFSVL